MSLAAFTTEEKTDVRRFGADCGRLAGRMNGTHRYRRVDALERRGSARGGSARRVPLLAVVALAAGSLLGCVQPADSFSGFLKNYAGFIPNEEGVLVERVPGVDFKQYDRILIEPITLFRTAPETFEGLSEEELKQLADDFHAAFADALKDRYPIASEPGPSVMRLRAGITEARPTRPVANTVSTLLPPTLIYSIGQYLITGRHIFVGETSMELELVDSVSGERLSAAVDRRAGRKLDALRGATRWGYTEKAFHYWAHLLRRGLDEATVPLGSVSY